MVKIDFHNATEPAINDTNLNQMQLNIETAINAQVSGDTLPVGCIVPFTSDTVPENWLLCDGQAVSRTDYALLFSIIGTIYGVGDGSTTFNLPNLKGRVAVGKDSTQTEFDNLGETGGEKTHTLTIAEMPSHNHTYDITSNDGAEGWARNGNWNAYGQHTTGSTGGGQPHNILQPYQVTNYIIKAYQSAGIVATVVDSLNSTSTTNALSANQGKVLNEKITTNSSYSTTETEIGTWIDGKPLYRKVIEAAVTSGQTYVEKSVSSLNIDKITEIRGIPQSDPASTNYYETSSDKFRIYYNPGTDKIIISLGTSYPTTPCDVYVILEYTKTTD